MVVYILYIQADLENIESLSLTHPESLCLSVRNPQDLSQTRDNIEIDCSVLHNTSLTDSHGKQQKHRNELPSHFALKWNKSDPERATIRVLGIDSEFRQDAAPNPHTVTPSHDLEDKTQRRNKRNDKMSAELEAAIATCRSMTADDSGNLVPMLALECHHLEPVAFHPGTEFNVVSKNGKTYANIDLGENDGDWSDYDLSTGSVSVTNLVGSFS